MINHQAEILQALAEFKAEGPWSGKIREKEMKFAKLFVKLRNILELPGDWTLRFEISHYYRDWTDSGASNCNYSTHIITLKGRLSVLTFLHEVAHALFQDHNELHAHEWSEQLFELAFPEQWAKLHRDENTRMLQRGAE